MSSSESESASPSSSDAEIDAYCEAIRVLMSHQNLLQQDVGNQELHEISSTPIITGPILSRATALLSPPSGSVFPQHGLLAADANKSCVNITAKTTLPLPEDQDARIFFNVAAPSSTFICGSQGSGKSHTLSCLLESCLMPSAATLLPAPLSGLVFHYDSFISDNGGAPCEAAFLSSEQNIKVRVLCAPTSFRIIQRTYSKLPNVIVQPLQIREADLNTRRMLDLMAVRSGEGPMPLYLHTVTRILREMRLSEQENCGSFSYMDFNRKILSAQLHPSQLGPLAQRLDTLESFMPKSEIERELPGDAPRRINKKIAGEKRIQKRTSNQWSTKPGSLTIIDLSCPCVTPETACSLFNICLSLFLEQDTTTGRVVALDEAHKFMNSSTEASTLTDTLLSTIRLQRHLGTRVLISTQEPTISPALLDLCSITIVHRFSSPEWLRALKGHLAAAAWDLIEVNDGDVPENRSANTRGKKGGAKEIFDELVNLRVGEALLFSPSTIVGLERRTEGASLTVKKLGGEYLKVRVRARLTADGGRSVMAA